MSGHIQAGPPATTLAPRVETIGVPRGGGIVVGTSSGFTNERAPCGRRVAGSRHLEDDDRGMVFDDVNYACGCRTISHQFHDGSVRTRVTRHDGRVLSNQLSAEHAE
jgi:hypothetical protein